MQWGLLKNALAELKAAGIDTSGCRCPGYQVQEMTPELAAEVILHVQRNYHQWIPTGASWQKEFAVHACSSGLIVRLLPIAKSHIMVLREKTDRESAIYESGRVLVRVTPALLQDVATLLALVRKNRLDWVARRISAADYAWAARCLSGPSGTDGTVTQLCVSETEFWFRGQRGWRQDGDEIVTEHLRLSDLVPVALLEPEFFEGLAEISETRQRPYEGRLRAIEFADHLHSTLSESSYALERALPTETITLVERLWFGTGEEGTFARQRRQYEKFQEALDRWEAIIDEERDALAKEVLGIGKGDHATFTTARGVMKLRVTGTYVYADEKAVRFGVYGMRFNKDGLLGQRQESIHFTVARSD